MSAQKAETNNEFLVAEYSALSAYFNTIINFRMIVFGFFTASISVLLTSKMDSLFRAIAVFILTLMIWLLELRNRSISAYLTERGSEIENSISWKEVHVPGMSFFHYMHYGKGEAEEIRTFWYQFKNLVIPDYMKPGRSRQLPKIEGNPKYYLISHTFVFDVTYSVVLIISFLSILIQLLIPMEKWILFGFS